jgi:predicted dehydrogenase
MNKPIWLIGAGGMALDYAKVLKAQSLPLIVVGRGTQSAAKFEDLSGISVFRGGIREFVKSSPDLPSSAIVSVGIEELKNVTTQLLNYGIKRILVEKPAGLNMDEINQLHLLSKKKKADVYVGYNRRFYASARTAREIIRSDGGVSSFTFEFTEWNHVIEPLKKLREVKDKWFLANSSHVVDLAFYIGGRPSTIQCNISGRLKWHPSASVFSGSGITQRGALFSYHANWEAPGRWGVEFLTKKHRLILRPLEILYIQSLGETESSRILIDDVLDQEFKPGLYRQVQDFVRNETHDLCSIYEHYSNVKTYYKIAGYHGRPQAHSLR